MTVLHPWHGVHYGEQAPRIVNAIIEIPQGSRCKYEIDKPTGLLKLDADYVDSYLVVGVNNYVVGSLPWYFKVFASLTGRHGDRAEGLRQVKQVTERGNYAREDSKLMLAVLYQREKMHAPALTLYQEMAHSYPRNYLLQYEVFKSPGFDERLEVGGRNLRFHS